MITMTSNEDQLAQIFLALQKKISIFKDNRCELICYVQVESQDTRIILSIYEIISGIIHLLRETNRFMPMKDRLELHDFISKLLGDKISKFSAFKELNKVTSTFVNYYLNDQSLHAITFHTHFPNTRMEFNFKYFSKLIFNIKSDICLGSRGIACMKHNNFQKKNLIAILSVQGWLHILANNSYLKSRKFIKKTKGSSINSIDFFHNNEYLCFVQSEPPTLMIIKQSANYSLQIKKNLPNTHGQYIIRTNCDNPNFIILCFNNGKIYSFQYKKNQLKLLQFGQPLPSVRNAISGVQYFQHNTYIFAQKTHIYCYSIAEKKLVWLKENLHNLWIETIALTKDKKKLASVSVDLVIIVLELENLTKLWTKKILNPVFSINWNFDGSFLMAQSNSQECFLSIFDARDGKKIFKKKADDRFLPINSNTSASSMAVQHQTKKILVGFQSGHVYEIDGILQIEESQIYIIFIIYVNQLKVWRKQ